MYRGAGLVSVPRYTAVLFSYTKPRLTIYGTVTDFSDLLVLKVESSNILFDNDYIWTPYQNGIIR